MNVSFLDMLFVFIFLLSIGKMVLDSVKGKTKRDIGYLILITLFCAFLTAWIFWDSIKPATSTKMSSNPFSKDKEASTSEQPPEIIEESIKMYEKVQPTRLDIGDKGANEEKKIVGWDDFTNLVDDDQFVSNFKESIIKSYKKKTLKYEKILKSLRDSKTPGRGPLIDIENKDRQTDECIREIDNILSTIDDKLRTQTVSKTKKDLQDVIKIGNGIVARKDVKDKIAVQIFAFSRSPETFLDHFQNMALYGPSGIGKTKLAETIAKMYGKCGILIRGNIRLTTKNEFTTAYVDESAKLTRKVLMNGLESITFIDEAYSITPERSAIGRGLNHGDEAIAEMVNFLDKYVGLSIVIVAGYKDQMESRFMEANEGMRRRFPHIIELQKYDSKQLFQICAHFLGKSGVKLTDDSAGYLFGAIDIVEKKHPQCFDKQAGDMQNLSSTIGRYAFGCIDAKFEDDYQYIIRQSIQEFCKTKGIEKIYLTETPLKKSIDNIHDYKKNISL